jgi:carbamoyl-phosphate synthase large subunit
MKVLITSIGSTPSIGVVKFIKASQRDVEIIGTDINCENRIAGSSLVHKFLKVPPFSDVNYLDAMMNIVIENRIQILIPIHDDELQELSKVTEKFKEFGCTIIVSKFATIEAVNDKYTFAKLLYESNILTPPTYSPEQWEKMDFSEMDFWIMKPLKGVSSRGIYKGSTNEILLLLKKFAKNKHLYIIQEFISGKEYTLDLFVKDKITYCIVPRVREETRDGLCYKSYTVQNEKFCDVINKILPLYDFYGPINIQFIEASDGRLYCIECNPRFGGSSVTTLYAGINLFQFILDEFENKPISFCSDYKKIFMTRYWEEVVYEI